MKRTQRHSQVLMKVLVSGDEETEMPTHELEVHEPDGDSGQSMDVINLGSEFNRRGSSLLEGVTRR